MPKQTAPKAPAKPVAPPNTNHHKVVLPPKAFDRVKATIDKPPKPTAGLVKLAAQVPTDPGPAPDVKDGKAFHAWCMKKQAYKNHIAATERAAKQEYHARCMELHVQKQTDPKRTSKAVIATLKGVVETYAYEGGFDTLMHMVTNDLDALLQEDWVQAIIRGEV